MWIGWMHRCMQFVAAIGWYIGAGKDPESGRLCGGVEEVGGSKANAKGQWPTRTHLRGVLIPRELLSLLIVTVAKTSTFPPYCAHLNFQFHTKIIAMADPLLV